MLRGLVQEAEKRWKSVPLNEKQPAKDHVQSKPVFESTPSSTQEDPRVSAAEVPKMARRE
jgi:hypothetical protein